MVDEMAIEKHIEWDGKHFVGYVDIGAGVVDDSAGSNWSPCIHGGIAEPALESSNCFFLLMLCLGMNGQIWFSNAFINYIMLAFMYLLWRVTVLV